eukprot:scaffold830_cov377-Prasinococcus_capsulatus_cf.AAC.4
MAELHPGVEWPTVACTHRACQGWYPKTPAASGRLAKTASSVPSSQVAVVHSPTYYSSATRSSELSWPLPLLLLPPPGLSCLRLLRN